MLNARAITGGPSSGWRITQPRASTSRHAPTSQSPETSHPPAPASKTYLIMSSPVSAHQSPATDHRREQRPPAPFELAAGAVVVRLRRDIEAADARGLALLGSREEVPQARQQARQIGRLAEVARAPMGDELGETAVCKRDDRQPHASRFERDVAECFFLKNRRRQHVARLHDLEHVFAAADKTHP